VKRGKADVVAEGVPVTRTEVPLAAAELVTRAEVVMVELERAEEEGRALDVTAGSKLALLPKMFAQSSYCRYQTQQRR